MNPTRSVALTALLLATACTTAETPEPPPQPTSPSAQKAPDTAGYRAGGNEPFWTLTFGESSMDFADMGNATRVTADRPDPTSSANGWTFTSKLANPPFVVAIENRRCNDSMSGRPFPHTVTVTVAAQTFTGCGGETGSLITGAEWRVIRIDTIATDTTRYPTMSFDGAQTSGSGSCNSYSGPYSIRGEGFKIGPLVATEMACAETAANGQETRFFNALQQATRFDIAADGSLEIFVNDAKAIVARR